LQDTKERTKITGFSRGLNAKLPRAFFSSVQGRTGRGGSRSGSNRRCYGGLGAQVSHEIEKGDRGGLEDVLTGGGEEGEQPDFVGPRRRFASVGDSPRGPLKQRGNPHLKPATKQNALSLTMQVPNHAGYGPRSKGPQRPTKTTLLEIPSSRLRLARGRAPPRAGSAPFEGQHFPRAGSASLEGTLPLDRVPPRSRVRPALDRGPPRSRAPLTRAPAPVHGHLTP
jgi:hypothetical protein